MSPLQALLQAIREQRHDAITIDTVKIAIAIEAASEEAKRTVAREEAKPGSAELSVEEALKVADGTCGLSTFDPILNVLAAEVRRLTRDLDLAKDLLARTQSDEEKRLRAALESAIQQLDDDPRNAALLADLSEALASPAPAAAGGELRNARRYRYIREHRPKDWQHMPADVLDKAIDKELSNDRSGYTWTPATYGSGASTLTDEQLAEIRKRLKNGVSAYDDEVTALYEDAVGLLAEIERLRK